jgi:hypothetical protein
MIRLSSIPTLAYAEITLRNRNTDSTKQMKHEGGRELSILRIKLRIVLLISW